MTYARNVRGSASRPRLTHHGNPIVVWTQARHTNRHLRETFAENTHCLISRSENDDITSLCKLCRRQKLLR